MADMSRVGLLSFGVLSLILILGVSAQSVDALKSSGTPSSQYGSQTDVCGDKIQKDCTVEEKLKMYTLSKQQETSPDDKKIASISYEINKLQERVTQLQEQIMQISDKESGEKMENDKVFSFGGKLDDKLGRFTDSPDFTMDSFFDVFYNRNFNPEKCEPGQLPRAAKDLSKTNCVPEGNIRANSFFGVFFDVAKLSVSDLDCVDCVGAREIAENAVGPNEIAENAVGYSEIAENAVDYSEIAENAVGPSEIAENAVGPSEIAENAVGPSEIAENAVDYSELQRNSVDYSELQRNAVGASELNMSIKSFSISNNGGTKYEEINMVPVNGKNFCFLTKVMIENIDDDSGDEWAECDIDWGGKSHWELQAVLGDYTEDAEVSCQAACVKYG